MAHAKLSPSSAHRWMRCPGSVAVHVDGGSSSYADEGTVAHEVRALCIRTGVDPQAYVGRMFNAADEGQPARMVEWTSEHADALRPDIDRLRSFLADKQYFLEVKVPIDHITREGNATGTADLIAVEMGAKTVLYVDDLKFGAGVKVNVEENEQTLLYAVGAVKHLEPLDIVPDEVVLSISQPRIDGHSEWRITYQELQAWAEKAHGLAVRTTLKDAPRIPGFKQCKWCGFKAECPEALQFAQDAVQADFDDESSKAQAQHDVVRADGAKVARMMHVADFLEELIKAYRARGEAMLYSGVPVPGWKLVQGKKGARKWADGADDKVVRVCVDDLKASPNALYEPATLKTPAKLEKIVGKPGMVKLAGFITQSPGGVSIAPEGDPRPAYSPAAGAEEFENHEQPQDL